MSRLIKVADWSGETRANVVFVHGLGGHPYDTWRTGNGIDAFWPLWLAEDVKGLRVYTYGYVSPATNWVGTAMPLLDQAANVLRVLLNSEDLRNGLIVFICHSLGGLLLKQVLRDANEQRADPTIADFLDRTRQVIFLATPHTGSGVATLMERLRFLAWASDSARDLVANAPSLRALNLGYRELARLRGAQLTHLAFYEMADTAFGRIVDPASADPGLPNCRPVPVREDHVTMSKPLSRQDLIYTEIKASVTRLAPEPPDPGELRRYAPEPFVIPWSWQRLVPKLLRAAALILLALGLWQGLPRLVSALRSIESTESHVRQSSADMKEVKALVQQLIANSALANAPAVERAVSDAVEAAAAGAASGDSRLAAAYAALKAGRVADAEALFRNVAEAEAARARQENRLAEERAARARQANQNAAAAFRNLGAIAGLSDPRRALEAYTKALELDGDDLESLVFAGEIETQRGSLGDAERHYRHALTLAKDDGQAWYAYWATLGLGDIALQRGRLDDARTSYQDARGTAERLARADPANAGWQRDLSVSYIKIGDVLVAQGNLQEALKAYRDSRDIRERLARADPANAGWQRDLSVSHDRIGDVLVAQGNLPEALKAFRDGRDIAERLARADPANAGWQHDLAVSHAKLAGLHRRLGDSPAAREALRQGQAIMRRLTQLAPDHAVWRRDLAWFDAQLAALAR